MLAGLGERSPLVNSSLIGGRGHSDELWANI